MQNLGDIYDLVLIQLGKDQWGSYVTPDNFNELAPKVSTIKLNQLIERFEIDRQLSTDLNMLITSLGDNELAPLNFDDYGYADLPSDYFYFARGEFNDFTNTCDGVVSKLRMVEFLDQAKFNVRVSNEMKKPTRRQPILTVQNDKLLIRPILPSVRFTYVRQPKTVFFDYDIINEVPVYLPPNAVHVNSSVLPAGTPSRSVEYEFPISVYPDLVNLLVREYSIKIRSEFGIQTTSVTQ